MLSEEHELIRKTVRQFAEQRVEPQAMEHDESGTFNVSLLRELGKMGLIAERCSDLYIHLSPRTKFWDTCGPEIILEEAGGRVTDLFGEPICYSRRDVQNHGGIVASNGAIHVEAIKRLGPLLHEFGRLNYKPKAEAH